jgi:hypothetical protein
MTGAPERVVSFEPVALPVGLTFDLKTHNQRAALLLTHNGRAEGARVGMA